MVKDIKAIVLAAGKGTRMKSSVPKVLHKIFDKALLERVIDTVLNIAKLDEIFVVVGHQSEKVTEFINNTYTDKLVSTLLQQPQLGTGDAVFKAYDKLADFKGTVLVLCGDTPLLTNETLQNLVQFHQNSHSDLTILSANFENPSNYGRIVRDEKQNVKKIVEEKDATIEEQAIKEINAGVYCLEWEKIAPAFLNLKTNNAQGEYYLTDIVDWSVNMGLNTNAFVLEDNREIFGINSRSHLAEAIKILNERTLEKLMVDGVTIIDPSSTWISPETSIGQDSIVYPNCYLDGKNKIGENCILGPDLFVGGNIYVANNVKIFQSRISNASVMENSTIGPFTHIRDNAKISSNVRIGNFVEIKKSEIDQNTNVSHLSYVGDSSLGKDVNIGAGTITANYNPLTKQKSHTKIEDGVKIGSNSVLVAPVKISKNANVAAGSVITKDVPENSLAIAREKQKVIENWVNKKIEDKNKE